MQKIEFALCVSVALFAPVFVGTSAAQSATWTATSPPVQATIAGGPWTLGQGGIVHRRRGIRRADPLLHARKKRRRHSSGKPCCLRQHV